jgi:F-type H+-transporting ATPase subunit a
MDKKYFFTKNPKISWGFVWLSLMLPSVGTASGGDLVSIVNYYKIILEFFSGNQEFAQKYWLVLSGFFGFVLITVVGVLSGFRKLNPSEMTNEQLLPPESFGLSAFVEMVFGMINSTLESVLGEDKWQKFAPLLCGTFLYTMFCNLSGLWPGFLPATESMSTNLAIASVIFIMFNYYGFKYCGMDYVKHLMGPMLALAPLMFAIELISLFARPVSLSLRLFGNITGDHLVFQVFSTLVKNAGVPFLPIPAVLLVFGLLVCVLQPFIFSTLSAIYIKLSIESSHHDEHH